LSNAPIISLSQSRTLKKYTNISYLLSLAKNRPPSPLKKRQNGGREKDEMKIKTLWGKGDLNP